MNPLQLHDIFKHLLQWDVDRLSALFTGVVLGGIAVAWLMYHFQRSTNHLTKHRIEALNEDIKRLEEKLKGPKTPPLSGVVPPPGGTSPPDCNPDDNHDEEETSDRIVYLGKRKLKLRRYSYRTCGVVPFEGGTYFTPRTSELSQAADRMIPVTREWAIVKR
jgi:hypothetical protein